MRKRFAFIIGLLIPIAFVGALLAQTSETYTAFINGAPAAGTLNGTELMPVTSGGVTRQTTVNAVAGLAAGAVTSFNTRTGAVTLTTTDVTAALGYTPLKPANNLSDVNSPSTARSNLGLGTAATQNTGTSGANLPFLNGNNTFSGESIFSGAIDVPPVITTTTSTMGGLGNQEICVDTTSSLLTITLPASPTNGRRYLFTDCKGKWGTNKFVLVAGAGQTIQNAASLTNTTTNAAFGVTWYNSISNWTPH